MAPVWLNIDQDTLIFVLQFAVACYETIGTDLFLDLDGGGETDPMMQSFIMVQGAGMEDSLPHIDDRKEELEATETVFETLSLSGIDLEIDFQIH